MKHEQKVKAVKDLQEEYDRRSEIEEQAFALLAEGKFKEAQELLDSLDDKQALEMLKESVEEYGEEQTRKEQEEKKNAGDSISRGTEDIGREDTQESVGVSEV